MLQIIQKYGFTLAIFSFVLTSLNALMHVLTQPIIDERNEKQKKELFNQVIPSEIYDNNLQKNCFLTYGSPLEKSIDKIYVAKKGTKLVGVVMESVVQNNYLGKIRLLIGSDFSGTVFGIHVIEQYKTPRLGNKIKIHNDNYWMLRFKNRIIHNNDPLFVIRKDGSEFEQFTRTIIIPRAVKNTIKLAVLYAQNIPTQISIFSLCKK